jgi:hypothetical protein
MKTIKYYTSFKMFVGWSKFRSLPEDYLNIKSWINSGNFIKLDTGLTQDLNLITKYFKGIK